jgi:hypothetical protein
VLFQSGPSIAAFTILVTHVCPSAMEAGVGSLVPFVRHDPRHRRERPIGGIDE